MFRHISRRLLPWPSFCTLSNKVYGIASKIGGASSDSLYDRYSGNFRNNDLMDLKQKLEGSSVLPGVTIITNAEECKRCVELLMKSEEAVAAWDTETMDLDIKQEAPVGKGKIICASFFAGPEYDFGRGPRVFIDNFGENAGLLDHFKPYL
jgi:DNA polymerase I